MKTTDFIAELKYNSTEDGGRKTPAYPKYRPHIQFENFPEMRTSGQQIFIGKDKVHPGETVSAEITIIASDYFKGKLSLGDKFIFCEGSHIIGSGFIVKFLNIELQKQ
jgi:translation elongation factor EF-Tu-like GTPase